MNIVATLNSGGNDRGFRTEPGEHLVASTGDISHCLNAGGMGRQDFETETLIARSLRAEGFDASEDGTGRGTPIVPVAFAENQRGEIRTSDVSPQLSCGGGKPGSGYPAVAYCATDYKTGKFEQADVSRGLTLSPDRSRAAPIVGTSMAVRRLTPRECERLQGFPDDWTRYDNEGNEISDSARYRMIGNAVARVCGAWFAKRIAEAVA